MPNHDPASSSAKDAPGKGARELANQAEQTSGQDRADDAEEAARREAEAAERGSGGDK